MCDSEYISYITAEWSSRLQTQEFTHEVLVWSHLNHPHIAKLLGVTPFDPTVAPFNPMVPNRGNLMVSEWMGGGSLDNYMGNLGKEKLDNDNGNQYPDVAKRLVGPLSVSAVDEYMLNYLS